MLWAAGRKADRERETERMRECVKCGRCYDDSVDVCLDDNSDTTPRFSGSPILNTRYRLLRFLGRSSLGRVYLAQDEILIDREVAIRIFESGTVRAGVLEELANKLASVQSANVVEITDFGTGPDGCYFIVMNRMACETVYDLVKRTGKIALPRAAALLRQIASGVVAIQEKGMLHGALSPKNVFLEIRFTTLGGFTEELIVKVSDFGWDELRTLNATEGAPGATGTGREVGVLEFLAPEQIQPGVPVDIRADVYGLGAVAFFMLSGQSPFAGDIMQVVVQKTMDDPRPLASLCPDLSSDVVSVIMAAIRRDPAERHQSISDWIAAFEAAAEPAFTALGSDPAPGLSVSAPAGSTIYLDDERQGDVDSGGTFSLLLVQPGVHLVRVRFPNGSEDERLVEFQGNAVGQENRVRFDPAVVQSDHHVTDRAVDVRDPVRYEREWNMSNEEPGAAPAPNVAEQSAAGEENRPVESENRMDCPQCGTSNRATSKFCRMCRASLKPVPAAEPQVTIEPAVASEPVPEPIPEPLVQAPPMPPADAIPAAMSPELPPAIPETSFDPTDEVEAARRQLEAEEERLRLLSEALRQRTEEPVLAHEEPEEEFATVVHTGVPLGMNASPENQGPTEELEKPAAPPVAPLAAPVRSGLPETMGGAGGLQIDVPNPVPPSPAVYRSPGRPKTIETTGTSFDSKLSDAAKGLAASTDTGAERSQSYYLGIGAIMGAIILAILGLIAFVVYWFVLSK